MENRIYGLSHIKCYKGMTTRFGSTMKGEGIGEAMEKHTGRDWQLLLSLKFENWYKAAPK